MSTTLGPTVHRPDAARVSRGPRVPFAVVGDERAGANRGADRAGARGGPGRDRGGRLRITSTAVIGADELAWRFTGSGGPGGQHANTSNTRVEVRFDVGASPSLGPGQRARLIERLGPVVRAVASDSRSQARNRELALERLIARLADGLRVEKPRKPTKVKRGAKEARLHAKARRGEVKQARRRPITDD
jgi:ribosome-associated protein